MSDYNLYSYYEDSSGLLINKEVMGTPTTAPHWSDTVKITSGCTNLQLRAERIHGGKEDCVDFNNLSTGCSVDAAFYPQGKYLATIKGGCHGILLTGDVYAHGSEVDVDIGGWSDQEPIKPTTGTILGLWSKTGHPIRVRVLNGTKFTAMAGSGPYTYVWPRPETWYHPFVVKIFLFLGRKGWI